VPEEGSVRLEAPGVRGRGRRSSRADLRRVLDCCGGDPGEL
jgi:hypothetical protein